MNQRVILVFLGVVSFIPFTSAAPAKYEDGKFPPPKPPEIKWTDLLSGKLEDHWSDMNCSMAASFKLANDDKGVAVLAGSGKPIGLIRSLRPYENFILEMDWRHLTEAPSAGGGGKGGSSGNSGLYVWADPVPPLGNCFTRAIEVQICNLGNGAWYTSHGDLFPIHGATMIPDPRFGVTGSRSMPIEFRGSKTGEWNRCRITCVDGTIQEEVNGAVVTAGYRSSPRKGYLCFESEGGPVEFKNVRISELAGDPALKPEQVSIVLPEGVRTTCLFSGVSLDGWTVGDGDKEEWTFQDRMLHCAGKAKVEISREVQGGDFTVMLDWSKEKGVTENAVPASLTGLGLPATIPGESIHDGWNRVEFKRSEGKVSVTINGKVAVAEQPMPDQKREQRHLLQLTSPGHAVNFCNIMCIDAGK